MNETIQPESRKQDKTFKKGDTIRKGSSTYTVASFENGESAPSGYKPAIVRFVDGFGYRSWEYAFECDLVPSA